MYVFFNSLDTTHTQPHLMSRVRVHPSLSEYKKFVTALSRFKTLDLGAKMLCTHQLPAVEADLIEVTVELTTCNGDPKPIAEALVAFLKAADPDWDPVLM